MTSNFWHIYEHAGYVELADQDGNDIRVELCRDQGGRLGIVLEGPQYSQTAGKLSADFGPDFRGFGSVDDARKYAEHHVGG